MKKYSALIPKSLIYFSLWLVILITVSLFVIARYPFTPTFPYHQMLSNYPRLLSITGYFDGVNYLRLSLSGYNSGGGEVAFFPLFPLLIRGLISLSITPLLAAFSISLFSLILFILIIYKLYPQLSNKFILLFLTFPTSFFLLSVYTESLFLLLFVLVLFLTRRRKFFLAALTLAMLTSTRLVGVFALIYLIYEMLSAKQSHLKIIGYSLFALSGLFIYMLFLFRLTGDPLAFIHVQPQFGMGRSGGELIFLPQVLYRYLKMLITIPLHEILYWRVLWELATFIFFSGVLVKYWRKLSIPDRLYSSCVVLLPTLSGTLSSFPRYALVAIPLFLVLAKHLRPRYLYILSILQLVILILNLTLFTRGLFVA
ncbi:MAG: hypothetical protein ABII80_02905 [bacterium]